MTSYTSPPYQVYFGPPHPFVAHAQAPPRQSNTQRVRFSEEITTHTIHTSNAPSEIPGYLDTAVPSAPALPPRSLPDSPEVEQPALPADPSHAPHPHARNGNDVHSSSSGRPLADPRGLLGVDLSRTARTAEDGAYPPVPHTRTIAHAQSGYSAHRTYNSAGADDARGTPSPTSPEGPNSLNSVPPAPPPDEIPSPASSWGTIPSPPPPTPAPARAPALPPAHAAATVNAARPATPDIITLHDSLVNFDFRTMSIEASLSDALRQSPAFPSGLKSITLRLELPTESSDVLEERLQRPSSRLTVDNVMQWIYLKLYAIDKENVIFYTPELREVARTARSGRLMHEADADYGYLRVVDLYPQNRCRFRGLQEVPAAPGEETPVYRVVFRA